MKYCISFSSGRELETDQGTFTELTTRVSNGRHAGWYTIKHGPNMGCSFNFTTIASIEVIMSDKERKEIERKKEQERLARQAKIQNAELNMDDVIQGSFEHSPKTCPINHAIVGTDVPANIKVMYRETDRGTKQYFPTCTMCGWRGRLVKPAALVNSYGIEPGDVEQYKG
jgi:hypothetical protein